MAHAYTRRMEGRMTECNAMKRPGKPDTGNPFVRFDEGRSGDAELTNTVCLICPSPLRLLYRHARALAILFCLARERRRASNAMVKSSSNNSKSSHHEEPLAAPGTAAADGK